MITGQVLTLLYGTILVTGGLLITTHILIPTFLHLFRLVRFFSSLAASLYCFFLVAYHSHVYSCVAMSSFGLSEEQQAVLTDCKSRGIMRVGTPSIGVIGKESDSSSSSSSSSNSSNSSGLVMFNTNLPILGGAFDKSYNRYDTCERVHRMVAEMIQNVMDWLLVLVANTPRERPLDATTWTYTPRGIARFCLLLFLSYPVVLLLFVALRVAYY